MRREVMWSAWDDPGLEHLRLWMHDESIVADGMVIGVSEGRPFRIIYKVRCDVGWRVRAVRVWLPGDEQPQVDLLSNGEGNWTTPDGQAVSQLDGCVDVDLSVTPFTNTFPIRRLGLVPTEYAEISVAYIQGTRLQAWPEPQRYTCLKKDNQGGLYSFLNLDSGFTADLPVDVDGLVLDYPGLFQRVFQDGGDPA